MHADRIRRLIRENRGLLCFIALMLVFRSAVADWNAVPTGSMKPTIVEGDRIWVDKLAYDLRIPFTLISLVRFDEPQRGDVIVFESAAAGKRLVKRVVGVPGDHVVMRDNQLIINGEPMPLTPAAEWRLDQTSGMFQLHEQLGDAVHRVQFAAGGWVAQRNYGPVAIPDGYYFVLGDNRDHSGDSRFIGLVPRGEIVGRTEHVVLSLNYDNYFLPRGDRFLQPLDPVAE